ncbi:hypothetical protein GLIP_0351 [Aliiglaciecola lipolytica E3]|uniref:Uncharacterized protein n=1 Tax=Aliiglaciecola lipolytica E3 TaxID=1127673 RepID=K6Y8M4_9ALTE|nr:hypothetical protein GLIP_0351 [Aliiglaciecola lipolytica E3]
MPQLTKLIFFSGFAFLSKLRVPQLTKLIFFSGFAFLSKLRVPQLTLTVFKGAAIYFLSCVCRS